MERAILAQDLTKRYPSQKNIPALSGLTLEVIPGQLYGLIGPDGAGKTTALRILSTVLSQTSGSARVAGYDVRSQPEKVRANIGYMPQNFSLYPDLSVQENLDFFADINGVAKADKNRRIDEMLTFINLADFRQRKAGHLSGGMKKKLALACALVHAPQVLLLDEPSTGVDPVSRRELWVLLSDVVQNGVTVLVSTPYMDEAERCHEVGILFDGQLLASGKPETLINQLPFSIVEVKASPRKAIRQIVSELAGISAWRPVGDRLRLSVLGKNGAAAHVMEDLQARMAAQSLDVKLLREARGSMEDVFIHRVENHQAVS